MNRLQAFGLSAALLCAPTLSHFAWAEDTEPSQEAPALAEQRLGEEEEAIKAKLRNHFTDYLLTYETVSSTIERFHELEGVIPEKHRAQQKKENERIVGELRRGLMRRAVAVSEAASPLANSHLDPANRFARVQPEEHGVAVFFHATKEDMRKGNWKQAVVIEGGFERNMNSKNLNVSVQIKVLDSEEQPSGK